MTAPTPPSSWAATSREKLSKKVKHPPWGSAPYVWAIWCDDVLALHDATVKAALAEAAPKATSDRAEQRYAEACVEFFEAWDSLQRELHLKFVSLNVKTDAARSARADMIAAQEAEPISRFDDGDERLDRARDEENGG